MSYCCEEKIYGFFFLRFKAFSLQSRHHVRVKQAGLTTIQGLSAQQHSYSRQITSFASALWWLNANIFPDSAPILFFFTDVATAGFVPFQISLNPGMSQMRDCSNDCHHVYWSVPPPHTHKKHYYLLPLRIRNWRHFETPFLTFCTESDGSA